MKMIFCALVLFLTLGASPANEPKSSEAAELAFGYAEAFKDMGRSKVTVFYSNSMQIEVIKEVKEVKAFGGILLIRIYGGCQQTLDPKRVIKIVADN